MSWCRLLRASATLLPDALDDFGKTEITMSDNYRSMWKDLGLDLQAHDMLLDVLGKAYEDIYLAQKDRPEGMGYFDFVMSEVHGLRIKELMDKKEAGRKIIGSYCVFVPEEIVLAGNATLVGLCAGADFAMEEVEKLLPRNTCALIKSTFGFKLGKVCPYLEASDMIVGENTCDGKKKAYESLNDIVPNLYVMDIPQMKTDQGRSLLKAEYDRFKEAVENLTGGAIDAASLKKGIEIVNNKRKAIHRLAELRKADPAPISGLDALLANQVFFYDNPVRFTESMNKICDELESRIEKKKGAFPEGAPRILMAGCPMAVPSWKLPWIIETAGAVIVGEESCVGERGARNLTYESGETVEEMMEAIVDRYFKIDCAIFTPNPDRLDHIMEMYEEYKADGVIHYGLQFCQPYLMESIPVEKALEEKNIPCLRIETDYSMEDVGQLKTRVEAFVEMLK
jgi:benzoyl-CoA reductase/2-hydroxyglutaryl-CoA dehydratase subunit BcrC/BadD/HgdB